MRLSGCEMDDAGGVESAEGKFGRDRTQEVGYKPQVRVYAIISHRSRVESKQRHVRDEFIKFSDSLVQATNRAGIMLKVVPDDL